MSPNAVDVVVLTWNDGPLLDVALGSLLASTGVDLRVFVVDNGSDPPATVPDDPRVTLVRNAENRGVAPGRSQGVALGDAPFVCLFDSDAVCEPGSLAALLAPLDDPTVAVAVPVFAGQAPTATAGRAPTAGVKLARGLGRRDDYEPLGPRGPGPVWDVDFGIGACQLFRRSVYDAVGGLDDTIFYGPEDVDFCVRVKAAGHRVVQVDGTGIVHPARRTNRRLLTRSGVQHGWQVARYLVKRRARSRPVAPAPEAAVPGSATPAPVAGGPKAAVRKGVQLAKSIVVSPPVGKVVGAVFHDRIPLFGNRIDTANAAIAPETKAQILLRLYERHELRFIREHLRTDLDIVELGASIGVTGSFLRRKLDPARRLVCVEAHPGLLGTLGANIGVRPGSDRSVVEHGAIDYSGADTVSLLLGDTTDGSAVGADGAAGEGGIEVPVLRLGDLLRRYDVGDYVLVCDIEGAEAGLLTHDAAALDRCRQLLIELHDADMTIPELGARIEELGFALRDESKRAKVYARVAEAPARGDLAAG